MGEFLEGLEVAPVSWYVVPGNPRLGDQVVMIQGNCVDFPPLSSRFASAARRRYWNGSCRRVSP